MDAPTFPPVTKLKFSDRKQKTSLNPSKSEGIKTFNTDRQ